MRNVLRFKLDEALPSEHLRDAARRENADKLQDQFILDETVLARWRNINALRGSTARRRAGAGRTCPGRDRGRRIGADGYASNNPNSGADDRTEARRLLRRAMPGPAIALVRRRNIGAVALTF